MMSPTLFYTEHDMASFAYHCIQEELRYPQFKDKEGQSHFLVHHEWPTPFRCNMKGHVFEVIDDNRNDYRKYKRGHYDIVVFNPEFIAENTYNVVKAQTFNDVKALLAKRYSGPVPVLFGIELMFRRTPQKGLDPNWIASIKQDSEKLRYSKRNNLMLETLTLAFDAFPNDSRIKALRQIERHDPCIRYIIPLANRNCW